MANLVSFICLCLSFLWLSNAQEAPCENCSCWEKCFASVPPSRAPQYAQLFQFVNQVRAGKLIDGGVKSSALLLDSSQPDMNSFRLQRNLVKLAAYALNSGPQCNPTALVSQVPWGAFWWFPTEDICPTACELDKIINYLPYSGQSSINPMGLTCYLAFRSMFGNPFKCQFSYMRYGVAFTNSPQTYEKPWCYIGFQVRSEVSISTPSSGFASAPWLQNSITYSPSLLAASESLVRCVTGSCCSTSRSASTLLTEEALENEESSRSLPDGTTVYVEATNPHAVKETNESLLQFLSNQENKFV
ncbi:hypothetical protein TCAL_16036 [Tigriopus californicus]|uniref:Uncharacterized protein n=2 Tax=Tigriopus californicus TaxID=6832 RepID=A0A553PQR5_TIGCA|nr:hypothetical protein TCAL_16036 [Tigriopus californicus]